MIAKAIANRPLAQHRKPSFAPRINYACSKVKDQGAIRLLNLTGDWRDAAEQMAFSAALNSRINTFVYHVALSWSETENRTDEDMTTAAEMVLEEFGAHGHQAVIAPHRDKKHFDVHIILNRVHPVTGKALTLRSDYERLERACRRVEHRMGFPADRGRFDIELVDGEIELKPKPPEHWERKKRERAAGLRPDGRAVRAYQLRTSAGYLRDSITEKLTALACKVLDTATDWHAVHQGLTRIGLEYTIVKTGARIKETKTGRFMQANQLRGRFSFGYMFKKLGAFVPPMISMMQSKSKNAKVPVRQVVALRKAQRAEERSVRKILGGARYPGAQALRAIMRDNHEARMKSLKASLGTPQPLPNLNSPRPDMERYRHAIRHMQSELHQLDDHTTRRQNWVLAPLKNDPYIPEIISDLIDAHPDAVRADGKGTLLFANRDTKSAIMGYERLDLGAMPPSQFPTTSAGGICVMGSRSAETCVLVRTPYEAITSMLANDNTDPLVIIVGNTPDAEQNKQIQTMLQNGRKAIAVEEDPNDTVWLGMVQEIILSADTKLQQFDIDPELEPDSDLLVSDGPV